MSEENQTRRKYQRYGLMAAASVAVLAAGVWVFSGDDQDNQSRAEDLRKRRAMTDVINPPGMADDFLSETGTRLAAIEGAVTRLEESNRRMQEAIRTKDLELAATRADLQQTRDSANAMIEDMAVRVAETGPEQTPAPNLSSVPYNSVQGAPNPENSAVGDPFGRRGVVAGPVAAPQPSLIEAAPDPRSVQIISFEPATASFETGVLEPAIYNTDRGDYVPPNAYAEAHVIMGVDMSTGVRLSADPKPVLLRITGPAYSVLEGGRRLDVDISGCLVNGAAHAELASERVYVRLQKITCDRGDGEVAESQVEGYVGQLGKVGVRGRVVSREGDIVSKALAAGILGGFGRGLSRNTDQVFAAGTGGASTVIGNEQLSAGEIAAGGLGEGLATAADTVSEYLIERAEQYQPVIEMPTGIDVEVVFLSGFFARGTE
ncbi:MAG: TraB/VirB10 family protein [Pseudomonadota bacterium]